jgi:hypothetical protein
MAENTIKVQKGGLLREQRIGENNKEQETLSYKQQANKGNNKEQRGTQGIHKQRARNKQEQQRENSSKESTTERKQQQGIHKQEQQREQRSPPPEAGLLGFFYCLSVAS